MASEVFEVSRNSAWYYARHQPAYPSAMFDFVVSRMSPRPGDCAVDVGCGTGAVALALAQRGARTIGIDPSPERIDQARADAIACGLQGRTQWHVGSGTDLRTIVRGPVQLVAFGKSLHRMNRAQVLDACDHLVAGDGGVTVLTQRFAERPLWMSLALPIRKHFQALVDADAGPSPVVEDEDHAAALARSPFSLIEQWRETLTLRRGIDDVIGVYLGMEGFGASALGTHRRAFEDALRVRLLEACPDGVFIEEYVLEVLCARRRRAGL